MNKTISILLTTLFVVLSLFFLITGFWNLMASSSPRLSPKPVELVSDSNEDSEEEEEEESGNSEDSGIELPEDTGVTEQESMELKSQFYPDPAASQDE